MPKPTKEPIQPSQETPPQGKYNFIRRPENVFLILALVFGITFLIITPPGQVADEYRHFTRAYGVSQGNFFGESSLIPRRLNDYLATTAGMPFHPEKKIRPSDLLEFWGQPLNPADQASHKMSTSVYFPIAYFFSGLGVAIGRLTSSAIIVFYIGRLFNLIIWILLGYLTLRTIPVYKWTFLLLMLSPMSLFQAASYSFDSFTNGLSFILIALCVNLALKADQSLHWRNIVPLAFLAVLLPMTKPAYAFLVVLVLLIPARKFSSHKNYILTMAGLILVAVALFVVSSLLNRASFNINAPFPEVVPNAQIAYILKHPFTYLWIILNTVYTYFSFMAKSYIGMLGWLDTYLPQLVYWTYFPVIILAALFDKEAEYQVTFKHKIILAITAVLTFVVIATGEYITWTPVGAPVINSMQGRYFVQVVPLLALLFYNQKIKPLRRVLPLGLVVYIIYILVTAVLALVSRFYY